MSHPDNPSPPPLEGHGETRASRVKRELRWIVYAWVFGSLWLWTINGATMTRFAKELKTPDWAFGLMAALPFIGSLAQLPASFLMERFGRRRAMFMVLATVHRLMWAGVAAVPWVLPQVGDLWYWSMILALFVGWAAGSASGPPWMSWMADVIPRRVRGRYFAFRARIGQAVGILTTVAIGLLLNWAEQHNHVAPGTLLKTTSILLAVAGLAGALDIQCFHRVRDDYVHQPVRAEHWLASVGEALTNRNFQWFLAFNFTLTLATVFMGQYVWLYALDEVGMNSMQGNLTIIAIPLVVMMMSYPIWGRLMDRLGKKPVLIIAGCCIVTGSIGWIFVGHDARVQADWMAMVRQAGTGDPLPLVKAVVGWDWSWPSRLGYWSILLTTFAWPGVEVANFNIILELAGGGKDRRQGASAYVAVNSFVASLGGTLSGLMAAAVAAWLKDFRWAVPLAGVVLTYHGVLFLLSAVLRLVAVGLALRIHEPRAIATREAFQYVTEHLYGNVRQAMLLPARVASNLAQWTYRLNPPRRRRRRPGKRGQSELS